MSRQEQWQSNRNIDNTCHPVNQFQLNVQEPNNANGNGLMCVKSVNFDAFIESKAIPVWNNNQRVIQSSEGSNNSQNLWNSNMENVNVWRSYTPVLDPEEPMEIDEDETTWPTHQERSTACNGDALESKNDCNVSWNSSVHEVQRGNTMTNNDTRMIWTQCQYFKLNQHILDSNLENINVWKSYKPFLDPEEPMMIDEYSLTNHQEWNTGCNYIGYNNYFNSSRHELQRGDTINTNESGRNWPQSHSSNINQNILNPNTEGINVWKSYKPVLDPEEPMEIDETEMNYFTREKSDMKINIRDSENRNDGFSKEYEFEIFKSYQTENDFSAENFQNYESTNEYPEYNADPREYSDDDVEFELWLLDYIQQLKENEETDGKKN